MRPVLLFILFCSGVSAQSVAAPANRAIVDHVTVELLSEQSSFRPGTHALVGIAIKHDPEWHTYWTNPGDSGLPTRLEWQLPNHYRAGEITWPAPQRFDLGGLFNFGYDNAVLLPVAIDVPPSAEPKSTATLIVNAKWLMCSREICVPGRATLQLDVPVRADEPESNEKVATLFAQARARTPTPAAWRGNAMVSGDSVRIELAGGELHDTAGVDVFPVAAKLLNNAPPRVTSNGAKLLIEAQRSDYFEAAPAVLQLVLTQKTGNGPMRAWQVEVPWRMAEKAAD